MKNTMKAITFGEIMMRLATPSHQRFTQAKEFEIRFGGAEANVAVSLAQFGIESTFVTALPTNPFGDLVLQELRKHHVHTEFIVRTDDRLGIYFLESGISQRASNVIYDRGNSAFAKVRPGMFDWKHIFKNASWFHVSGISPAVSESAAEEILEALIEAKNADITISCDLNYRKKLWLRERAEKIMSQIVQLADIVVANEEDAEMIFGIRAEGNDVTSGKIDLEKYRVVAGQLMRRFPQLKIVAITLRESISASVNDWSGVLWDGKKFYQSKKYHIHIVDRVGSGDAFCAGLIYSFLNQRKEKDALEFAVAASCLKHSIPGDFNLVSVAEVEALMNGDGSGRVKR